MFETRNPQFGLHVSMGAARHFDDFNHLLIKEALGLFNHAHAAAVRSRFFSILLHRPFQLDDLHHFHLPVISSHELGTYPLPIKLIRGSEGRSKDFDARFRPLLTHTRHRWLSVATARLQSIPLPAVDLIQVGDYYFVRDGNHRISVALALDEIDIDAHVIIWEVPHPLPWELEPQPSEERLAQGLAQVVTDPEG